MNIVKFYDEYNDKIKSYQFPFNFESSEEKEKMKQKDGILEFPEFDKEEEKKEEGIDSAESEEIEEETQEEELELEEPEKTSEQEAEEIIQEAQKQAQEILALAHEEAEAMKQTAIEEGKQEGYEKGYQIGVQEGLEKQQNELNELSATLLDEIEKVILDIEDKKEEIFQRYKEDLRNIAIAIGEKVIHVSLKASGEVIEKMIISATEKLDKRQWAKIYISKTDADLMVRGDIDIVKALPNLSDQLKVIVMENESPGTCIIELPDRIIDAGADTQVENIKGILNNAGL